MVIPSVPLFARLVAVLLLGCDLAGQARPITDAEFRGLLGKLIPKLPGRWETIPWSIDMLAARRRAIAEKKPLFMWAMNGHPLGCT